MPHCSLSDFRGPHWSTHSPTSLDLRLKVAILSAGGDYYYVWAMFFKAWAQPHKEHLTGGTQTEFSGLHFICIYLSRSLMWHCHTLVTSTSFSLEASPLGCLLGKPSKRQPYILLLDRRQSRGPSPGLSSSQIIMWVPAYLDVMIILLMSVAS